MELLVPVLDSPIQVGRHYFARLARMPLTRHDRPITRLNLMPHLTRLPVPEAHIPTRIATHHDLAVGTDIHIDRIPGIIMTPEPLLAVLPEPLRARVDDDLVVGRLEGDELA